MAHSIYTSRNHVLKLTGRNLKTSTKNLPETFRRFGILLFSKTKKCRKVTFSKLKSQSGRLIMKIAQWQVFPDRYTLTRGSVSENDIETVKVTPRVMDVLVYLTERPGEVVSTQSLLDAFWPAPTTTDHAVHKVIASLRSALGDDPHAPTHIKTLPRRGYMLIAEVSADAPLASSLTSNPASNMPARRSIAARLQDLVTPRLTWLIGLPLTIMLATVVLLGYDQRHATVASQIDSESSDRSGLQLVILRPSLNQAAPLRQEQQLYALLDALSTNLTLIPDLNVVIAESDATAQQMLSGMDEGFALSGTVYDTSDQLRLTIQLTDVSTGHNLYSSQFDLGEMSLAAIEDEVIPTVTESLGIYLDAGRLAEMRAWGTQNAQAFLHFQRADFFQQQHNHADWERALHHYENALQLDPSFINAYLGKATTANNMAVYSRNTKVDELSKEVMELSRRLALVAPDSNALSTLNSLRMRMEGGNEQQQEKRYREQILAGDAPGYVYSRYALFLIGARMYQEANAYLKLAQATEERRISPNQAWNFKTQTLPPDELADVKLTQLTERPVHIGILGTAISSLAFIGDRKKAEFLLARQIEKDREGVRAHLSTILLAGTSGNFQRRDCPWLFSPQRQEDPDLAFNNGVLQFLLGEFDAGAAYWSDLTRIDRRKLFTRLHAIEPFLPASVIDDSRYAQLLEALGVGVSWQRQLMEGVQAMSEQTGIGLALASRQHYDNGGLMVRNNLWTPETWSRVDANRPFGGRAQDMVQVNSICFTGDEDPTSRLLQ